MGDLMDAVMPVRAEEFESELETADMGFDAFGQGPGGVELGQVKREVDGIGHDAGLVSSTSLLSATSITGYSGGGKKMIEQYEAGGDPRLAAPRPYGLKLHHKHLPEMAAHSRLETAPVFMPIVGNFLKGLSVAVPLHLSTLKRGTTSEQLHAALSERYAAERFVRVMPLGDASMPADGYFDVQACNDSNNVELFVFASETQALLMCRLDNLGKGASGAAVQSMNVHLGLDEGTGL
jgi:N-acetyl-gamma-glutamyl-phosphate reductase